MTMTAREALTQAAEICEGQARKQFRRHDYTAGCRDAADLILALRDSLPEREGMVLVPREPTQAMHNAAHAAETKVGWGARDRIYRAMLDASNLPRKDK